MDKPKLKEIFIYPIKSFGGESIKLANLKNTEIDKMEIITSRNFNLLFNLK